MMTVEKMEIILDGMDQMAEEQQEQYANMIMQFATLWSSGYEAGFRAALAQAQKEGA